MKSIAKRLAAAVCAVFALSLSGCSEPVQTELVFPPMWEVSDSTTGGHVYMLGSMHVGTAGIQYPDYVLDAYSGSDIVVCELDAGALSEDRETLMSAVSVLYCNSGTTAADYFGDDYDRVRSFFYEEGIYSSALEQYVPMYWGSLLSNKAASDIGLSSQYGTENVFLAKAKKDGKQIVELETAAQQYGAMASASPALQAYSVTKAADDFAAETEALQSLYFAWKTDTGLDELCNGEEIPEQLQEDYDAYYTAMYTDRQSAMAQRVEEILAEGQTAFMFVGTAHFYAHPSVIDVLSANGRDAQKISTAQSIAA